MPSFASQAWCGARGGLWKLPDLWTHRTRPQVLAKPQNGFAQLPQALVSSRLEQRRLESLFAYRLKSPTDYAEEANMKTDPIIVRLAMAARSFGCLDDRLPGIVGPTRHSRASFVIISSTSCPSGKPA